MNTSNPVIAVNPSGNQPTLTLTLESTGILLGILVSFSMLLGGTIKVITKFNSINSNIRDLREDLNANTKALGQLNTLHAEVLVLDKKIDLHLQEYTNRKDVVQMVLGQLDEKINHKALKLEGMINDVKAEVRAVENYLQSQSSFRVRE